MSAVTPRPPTQAFLPGAGGVIKYCESPFTHWKIETVQISSLHKGHSSVWVMLSHNKTSVRLVAQKSCVSLPICVTLKFCLRCCFSDQTHGHLKPSAARAFTLPFGSHYILGLKWILLLITSVGLFVMKYRSNVWYSPLKWKWNHSHHLHPSPCSQKCYETLLMLYSKDALGLLPGERYNP